MPSLKNSNKRKLITCSDFFNCTEIFLHYHHKQWVSLSHMSLGWSVAKVFHLLKQKAINYFPFWKGLVDAYITLPSPIIEEATLHPVRLSRVCLLPVFKFLPEFFLSISEYYQNIFGCLPFLCLFKKLMGYCLLKYVVSLLCSKYWTNLTDVKISCLNVFLQLVNAMDTLINVCLMKKLHGREKVLTSMADMKVEVFARTAVWVICTM